MSVAWKVEPGLSPGLGFALARARARLRLRLAWREALGPSSPDLCLSAADNPLDEARFRASPAGAALTRDVERLDRAVEESDGPLRDLSDHLGLEPIDRAALELLVAERLDPELAEPLARAQGRPDVGYVTASVVGRLYDLDPMGLLAGTTPACRWALFSSRFVRVDAPAALTLDPFVLARIERPDALDPALAGRARALSLHPTLSRWSVESCVARTREHLEAGRPVHLVLIGPPGSGRRSFAALVAAAFGRETIGLELEGSSDQRGLRLRALRQAFASELSLATVERDAPESIPDAPQLPLSFSIVEPGGRWPPVSEPTVEMIESLPGPTVEDRARLWQSHWPRAPGRDSPDIQRLARHQRLAPSEIARIARTNPVDAEAAREACRADQRRRLAELGEFAEGQVHLSDVVVSESAQARLRRIVSEARARSELADEPESTLLAPQTGLAALFKGPPGTGKTWAARAIAGELGIDLLQVDLSRVVSKYIGETAKNLGRIFDDTEGADVLLLFDEADTLFSKRTEVKDAHDRHANTDVGYLLQRLERHRGLTILTANQHAHLDPAVLRRLRHVVSFPRPSPGERSRLFERFVARGVPEADSARMRAVLAVLAERVDLSGAQIRDAVLHAALGEWDGSFRLGPEALVVGVELELEKEGRTLSAREREEILRHA